MNTSDQNLTDTVVQSEAEVLYKRGVITAEEASAMANENSKVIPSHEQLMTLPFTREDAEILSDDNEGQRVARRLLIDIGETLTGVSRGDAENMRNVFLSQYGRAKAEISKGKANGRKVKCTLEIEWPKDSVPPFLLHVNECAELCYKLRKLGAIAPKVRMALDIDALKTRWMERYEK